MDLMDPLEILMDPISLPGRSVRSAQIRLNPFIPDTIPKHPYSVLQFLSEKWMAIYPYNVFYLIDLDQSVNKSREPHTPHYDINGILCGTTCFSSDFQCVY